MERQKNSTYGIDKIASQNMDGPNSFGVHIVKPLYGLTRVAYSQPLMSTNTIQALMFEVKSFNPFTPW